jgi:hypothetical protein
MVLANFLQQPHRQNCALRPKKAVPREENVTYTEKQPPYRYGRHPTECDKHE